MHVPNHRQRALSVFLLVAFLAIALACSSTGQPVTFPSVPTATPEPTATPITADTFRGTPRPVRTNTPLPPTPAPMRVIRGIPGLGEPVVCTVFEDLLARLPDNETTRSSTFLRDFAGTFELLGAERIPPGTRPEDIKALLLKLIEMDIGGLLPAIPAWPLEMRDYLSVIDWYPYVAFDVWSVDQAATARQRFGTVGQQSDPRLEYDIAFGQFDPDATANALAACNCDQPDLRLHDGVEYYAWGEEYVGQIQRRRAPPLYDHVGRGPRLLIREGEGYWAVADKAMEDMIEVLAGEQPSLADDAHYVEAVRLLSSLGHLRDITFASGGFSIDELDQNSINDGPFFQEAVRRAPLLERFEIVAESVGFDGERAFGALAIGHSDQAVAIRNADILEARLQKVLILANSNRTWGEIIESVELEVVDQIIVARIYFRDPMQSSFRYPGYSFIGFETLLVHE